MGLENELRKLHSFMTHNKEDRFNIDLIISRLKGLPVSKYGLESVAYMMNRPFLIDSVNYFYQEDDDHNSKYESTDSKLTILIYNFILKFEKEYPKQIENFLSSLYFLDRKDDIGLQINIREFENIDIKKFKNICFTDYSLLLYTHNLENINELGELHKDYKNKLYPHFHFLDKHLFEKETTPAKIFEQYKKISSLLSYINDKEIKNNLFYNFFRDSHKNDILKYNGLLYFPEKKLEGIHPKIIKYAKIYSENIKKLNITQFINRNNFFLPKNEREFQIAVGNRWTEYFGYKKTNKPIINDKFFENLIYFIETIPKNYEKINSMNTEKIIEFGKLLSTPKLIKINPWIKVNTYLKIINTFKNKEKISEKLIKNSTKFSINVSKLTESELNYDEIEKCAKYNFNGKFLKKLGEGVSSDVYLVEKKNMIYSAALKIFKTDQKESTKNYESALMDVLRHNPHKNIVKLYDAGENLVNDVNNSKHYYAILMEYIDGETLEERLKKGPIDNAEEISMQLLEGIYYLNNSGIYHRDIHDRNVKINSKGIVKIMDFGVATTKKEPYEKNRRYGGDSDYFSWALLTYHMFTGTHLICEKKGRTTNSWADRIKELKKEMRDEEGKLKQEYVDKIEKNMPKEYHETMTKSLEYSEHELLKEIIMNFGNEMDFKIEKKFYKSIGIKLSYEQYKEIEKRK